MPSTASLIFDGVNDVATASFHADLNITGDLTLEFWGKITDLNTDRQIAIGAATDSGGNVPFYCGTDYNLMSFRESNGYSIQLAYSASVSGLSGAWHHFAVTRSGRDIQWYVDGAASGSVTTLTGSAASTGSGVSLGFSVYQNYLAGKLDEVRIWNVARTSTEIAAYYNKKALGTETGLKACWHIDEGSGTTAADAAGTAQDLTISGATWDTGDFATITDAGGADPYPAGYLSKLPRVTALIRV